MSRDMQQARLGWTGPGLLRRIATKRGEDQQLTPVRLGPASGFVCRKLWTKDDKIRHGEVDDKAHEDGDEFCGNYRHEA
jgi:hypothetical protein